MVSEHVSGYISGFSVHTRKAANKLVAQNATLGWKLLNYYETAMGLLHKTRLLENHRTGYFLTITSGILSFKHNWHKPRIQKKWYTYKLKNIILS